MENEMKIPIVMIYFSRISDCFGDGDIYIKSYYLNFSTNVDNRTN